MQPEISASFRINKVSVKVAMKDSLVIRRCGIELDTELDPVLAHALGPDAKTARDGIVEGGMSEVKLPIDALECDAILKGEQLKCRIPRMRGVMAVVKPMKPQAAKTGDDNEDEEKEDTSENENGRAPVRIQQGASVRLSFEFQFADDVWIFLGRSAATWVDVTFRRLQQELGLGKTAHVDPKWKDEKKEGLAF